MDPEFLNTDGEHEHDTTVSSLSVILPGEVDFKKVQEWVGWVLRTQATDIYRMKGVLAIKHSRQKFVYQAVHMIFNGKNLDKEALKSGFTSCAWTPELEEETRAKLRFTVGDAVECKTSDGWERGAVVSQMYREDYMPPGMVAPYQVKLDTGDIIYAPVDEDDVIRKPM